MFIFFFPRTTIKETETESEHENDNLIDEDSEKKTQKRKIDLASRLGFHQKRSKTEETPSPKSKSRQRPKPQTPKSKSKPKPKSKPQPKNTDSEPKSEKINSRTILNWSPEEDDQLILAYTIYRAHLLASKNINTIAWTKISDCIPTKKSSNCFFLISENEIN